LHHIHQDVSRNSVVGDEADAISAGSDEEHKQGDGDVADHFSKTSRS